MNSATRLLCIAATLAAAVAAQDPSGGGSSLVIRAASIHTLAGEAIRDGQVVISDGKVLAVGPRTDGRSSGETIELGNAVVYPGFIDAASTVAIRRERDDTTRAWQPALRMAEAFDPGHPYFAEALAFGVTCVHLVPGDKNVLGGQSAVVKVSTAGNRARVLAPDTGLKVSLCEAEYADGRAPTSLAGALSGLRKPEADAAAIVDRFRDGKRPVFVSARTDREWAVATGLKSMFGFRTILCADSACGRFVGSFQNSIGGVVIDPVGASLRTFERDALQGLARSELPLAFGSFGSGAGASAVRSSAVNAFRGGVAEERILRSLTMDAARILGVATRVGSLEKGKDGDLVALSAPVTDPRARVLLVVQDGIVVHREAKTGEKAR